MTMLDERPAIPAIRSGAPAPERTIVPAAAATSSASRPTMVDDGARRLCLRLLRMLEGGSLTVREGGRSHQLGAWHRDLLGRAPLAATVEVHDPRTWALVLRDRSSGLGEAYLRGWWDADDLTAALRLLDRAVRRADPLLARLHRVQGPVRSVTAHQRRGDRRRDRSNVRAHYDLGNDLFSTFLDPTMAYSSAAFVDGDETLRGAQIEKMDRLCRRLGLREGQHVLEIGTGWGALAVHAAATYGVRVTTTTLSEEQWAVATARVHAAGLDDLVEVRRDDYRDLGGTFDAIVSVEMIEAVDWRDHDTFFAACRRLLRPEGALALQAITIPAQRYDQAKLREDFIKTHIFPGGCLPSTEAIEASCRRTGDLALVALEDLGLHYAETLRRWQAAFEAARREVLALGYDEAFARMWRFYLAYCEAAFEERDISAVQVLLAGPGWRPPRGLSLPSEV